MGNLLAKIAGRITTLLAVYDEDFYNLLCDTEGHLQVDVLSSPLPTDAATETTLALVKDRIGATTAPASGSTNKLLTDALTALQLIDDLRGALDSVGSDELDVNVDASVLPTGAATETTLDEIMDRLGDETSPASGSANAQLADIVTRIGALTTPAGGSTNKLLTDALTALQLIDNLYGALGSVATDRLIVRGEDQLFSLKDNLLFTNTYTMPADGNYSHDTGQVPAGEWWIVTNIHAHNDTTVATRVFTSILRGANSYYLDSCVSPVVWEGINWTGWAVLKVDDIIHVRWIGNLNGDILHLDVTGFRMAVET